MKEISTIGLDIAKTVFQIHGVDPGIHAAAFPGTILVCVRAGAHGLADQVRE